MIRKPPPLRPAPGLRVDATNGAPLLPFLAAVTCLLATSIALADRVAVDKTVKVSITKADKSKLSGRVASYDQTSFDLVKPNDEHVEVKWSELDATTVFQIRSQLITKPEGPSWLNLGRDLRAIAGGEKLAERAFANAIKADPKLKDAVDAARKEPLTKPTTATAPADPAETQPSATAPGDDPAGGPKLVGQVPKGPWKPLTADEQAKAVRELDAFAAETQQKMNLELIRHETSYFLFYCDLPQPEAKRWADLLDRMYSRLSELFATGKGVNVWHGKAVVFVFAKQDDYLRFERLMHNTDAHGTFGMCHNFGNGDVHIAFFRQHDAGAFAHVLVHESVHGFLHRFRTPVSIPSWVNEGLAETIATELVPPDAKAEDAAAAAKAAVEHHGNSLGGMLDAKPISDWQYPIAQSLTEFMIRSNKRGYVNFIIALKEGTPGRMP